MSPCLDDLVRDPGRAGLLSSEARQALLAQVVALLFALGAPAGRRPAPDRRGGRPQAGLRRAHPLPEQASSGAGPERWVRFSEEALETFIRQRRGVRPEPFGCEYGTRALNVRRGSLSVPAVPSARSCPARC